METGQKASQGKDPDRHLPRCLPPCLSVSVSLFLYVPVSLYQHQDTYRSNVNKLNLRLIKKQVQSVGPWYGFYNISWPLFISDDKPPHVASLSTQVPVFKGLYTLFPIKISTHQQIPLCSVGDTREGQPLIRFQ